MLKKILLSSVIFCGGLYANAIKLNLIPTSSTISYNSIVKNVSKSIVNIEVVKKEILLQTQIEQVFNDPFFKQFLPKEFKHNYFVKNSKSSGVILSSNGFIITTATAVKNAKKITVILWNKKRYNAKLIGIDKKTSLAILKIDTKFLTPIKISENDNIKVGDVVFAVGNPFGLENSISMGLVSYMDKKHFIQTSSVNSSNIGGALVNDKSVLVGINGGFGFAIPSSELTHLIDNISSNGDIVKGYVGVKVKDIDDNFKNLYRHKKGVIVLDILKNSPAFIADIKRGDLIFNINGIDILDVKQFNKIVSNLSPNDKVKIVLERDNKNISKILTIALLGNKKEIDNTTEVLGGLYLDNLTLLNSTKYRVDKNIKGVLITNVKASSKAEKNGFQSGDIIVQIENDEISNLDDISDSLVKYKNKPKRVFVNRYGQVLAFIVR